MIPPVSTERRDELHKKFAMWMISNKRPLSIGKSDEELRDIFDYIFQGGYVLPTYKFITQKVLVLSVEGKAKVKNALSALLGEGILTSVAGDLWSEGG
ncbi:hypothetical protein CYMTET_35464 [Cymbomonas tetramitiformis]|uniref:Uncharacterized protein n=1 Tax=Cymbomonas tetramitiformis TaxID=36881 RepID=A0AAE0KP42_9CHLO|nr:hypothetical protein CYMTET_35464 [Cymbomonas tetramitiformis]